MSTVGGGEKDVHSASRCGEVGCRDRSQGEAGREAVWDLTSRLDHRTGGAGSQRVLPICGNATLAERVGGAAGAEALVVGRSDWLDVRRPNERTDSRANIDLVTCEAAQGAEPRREARKERHAFPTVSHQIAARTPPSLDLRGGLAPRLSRAWWKQCRAPVQTQHPASMQRDGPTATKAVGDSASVAGRPDRLYVGSCSLRFLSVRRLRQRGHGPGDCRRRCVVVTHLGRDSAADPDVSLPRPQNLGHETGRLPAYQPVASSCNCGWRGLPKN